MAKINTPRGKLVRKFGENIFGNPKLFLRGMVPYNKNKIRAVGIVCPY